MPVVAAPIFWATLQCAVWVWTGWMVRASCGCAVCAGVGITTAGLFAGGITFAGLIAIFGTAADQAGL